VGEENDQRATMGRGSTVIKKRVMLIHIFSILSTDEFDKRRCIASDG